MCALLERDVGAVRELEVVPRDLVAQDRRPLEGAEPFLRDRLVVLVDVVVGRLEDDVGTELLPHRDEQLQDVLPTLGERPHVEVVHREVRLRRCRARRSPRAPPGRACRVGTPAGASGSRSRTRRSAPRTPCLDEPCHRAPAPELAVVGVRREHERPAVAVDHATSIVGRTARSRPGGPGSAAAARGAHSGAPFGRGFLRNGHDEPHEPEQRPGHRVLEEGRVEEAVHGDRDEAHADRERDPRGEAVAEAAEGRDRTRRRGARGRARARPHPARPRR